MYGAILGDLIGAPWEFKRMKRKDFNPLIRPDTGITDEPLQSRIYNSRATKISNKIKQRKKSVKTLLNVHFQNSWK